MQTLLHLDENVNTASMGKKRLEIRNIILLLDFTSKKASRCYSPKTFLCSRICIKLVYLRVKSAYEGGKKCTNVSVKNLLKHFITG